MESKIISLWEEKQLVQDATYSSYETAWFECPECHTRKRAETTYCPDCGKKLFVEQEETATNVNKANVDKAVVDNCINTNSLNWRDDLDGLLTTAKDGHIVTDSVLEDFAAEHRIPEKDVFAYIAELAVKNTPCAGCANACYFPDMFPCTACTRGKKDLFKSMTATDQLSL